MKIFSLRVGSCLKGGLFKGAQVEDLPYCYEDLCFKMQ